LHVVAHLPALADIDVQIAALRLVRLRRGFDATHRLMNPKARIFLITIALWATAAQAESVDVKYRGPVDLCL